LRGRGGHLDGIEHVLSGFLSCFVGPAPDAFALERREEGLGDGIVAAIAAVVPGLTDQLGLPGIVLSPLAPRALLPGIEATGLDAQTTTHQANLELVTMLGNRRLSHFVSLAKYAVAFFWMSRSSVTRAKSRFNSPISASLRVSPDAFRANRFFQAYSECGLTLDWQERPLWQKGDEVAMPAAPN